MKGLLRPVKEEYLVNEEKGVITYFIYFKPVIKDTPSFSMYLWHVMEKQGFKDYSYLVVGKAKCSSEDTFDKKKGIQIARNRAEIKFAQIEIAIIKELHKEYENLFKYIDEVKESRCKMIKEKKQFIKNV